jgi:hypothetical protein
MRTEVETSVLVLVLEVKLKLSHTYLRPYSKSTLNEWKFNLSFSRVSLLFLNSWGSHIPYYVTTHPPAMYSKTALTLKRSSD